MFNVTSEKGQPKQGFNFYPLSDASSFGFRLVIKDTLYGFRFAKKTKKFHYFKVKRGVW